MDETTQLPRRKFIVLSLAAIGMISMDSLCASSSIEILIPNVTGLYTVKVAELLQAKNTQEIAEAVRRWRGQISVGGARFSMGGQIGIRGGLHVDMRALNGLVWLKPKQRRVRVQAGMTWRDLQDVIDPHHLSIKTMQSFSNFSVGGSVSVNAHGRYVGNGALCNTVRALQLILADGTVVETDAQQNGQLGDLFRAAIGGYGAVGIITEVELDLVENVRLERGVQTLALGQYLEFFKARIISDRANVMHNADLYPPFFNEATAITWRISDRPLTEHEPLVPRGQAYTAEKNVIWAVTELPFADRVRKTILKPLILGKPKVVWRNHEASLDAEALEPRTRLLSTYALQEYFIPERHFLRFAQAMTTILRAHEVKALNISIRHSHTDKISLLAWAKDDVFSFVLYYKQRTHAEAMEKVALWTRELIELALVHEGRYYLPYQLHAHKTQFERAYPEIANLRSLKKNVDPKNKFSNEMWRKYL